ncbi:hypothetical protein ACFLUR_03315 [Chloroflexota bacterium]
MKGGALFTNSAWHYLKDVSNTDTPIEWQGGKLVVIVDEGVLNTDEYSKFREFIKTHYYIKAVISLTNDTFVPVSKTLTKTSILFLIKKTDSDAVQREPVFFAYVDKVGLNTKRKVCDNHLFTDDNITSVLGCYSMFRQTVFNCYTGVSLNSTKLTSLLKIGELVTIKGQSYYYIRQFSRIESRFDENYNNPKYDEIDEIIKKADATILLGDKKIIKNITSGRTPKGIIYLTDDTVEGIPFLGAHQISYVGVNLDTAPKISKEYHTSILKGSIIKKGRLLITMAGAVGRCSLYNYDEESNANQAVAIIELQENKDILPEYLKYYLNSKVGQLYFQKYQHVSSQPNINLEEIKRINIISLTVKQQETVIKESHKMEDGVLLLEKDIEAKKKHSKEVIDKIIIGT